MSSILPKVVFIDSDVEQAAWMYATFGPDGTWQTISQTMRVADSGQMQELLEVRRATGETEFVAFQEAALDESLEGHGYDRTSIIEDLLHIAAQFAEANPPHHPGSMPRFPVPANAYENAIAIPMPILAIDDLGQRGLYSPPRQVVLSIADNALIGFGDFPGFDPEMWPPVRVGDWPPATMTGVHEQQLQGIIQRFSCCWSRVLESWFTSPQGYSDVLRADINEGLRYRQMLDVPGFEEVYARINPGFHRWLEAARPAS
jgi:hypothetical protein